MRQEQGLQMFPFPDEDHIPVQVIDKAGKIRLFFLKKLFFFNVLVVQMK